MASFVIATLFAALLSLASCAAAQVNPTPQPTEVPWTNIITDGRRPLAAPDLALTLAVTISVCSLWLAGCLLVYRPKTMFRCNWCPHVRREMSQTITAGYASLPDQDRFV